MVVRETAAMIAEMAPRLASGEFLFCTTSDPALARRCAAIALGTFGEEEGPSFIIPAEEAAALGFERTPPMRQITLDVLSALDGVGLTAAVAGTLAERGIPCNAVAAHRHDHLFVPSEKAEEALNALLELSATWRRPPTMSIGEANPIGRLAIRGARPADEARVAALWRACGLVASYNDPGADFRFARAGACSDVLVGVDDDDRLCGTAMVGHDGHRGWLYYVAADPDLRGLGHGRQMVEAGEGWLRERGVTKVQLLVRETNAKVVAFYEHLGFEVAPRTIMTKWLVEPS